MNHLFDKHLFVNYPESNKALFIEKIDYDNYAKAKFFSYILLVLSFIYFILSYTIIDTRSIVISNFAFFVVTAINVLLFTLNNRKSKKISIISKFLLFSMIISVIAWSTTLVSISPNRNELLGTYAIVILAISAIFHLKWQVEVAIYSLSLFFTIFFTFNKFDPPILPKFGVMFSLVIISWIVSRMLYSNEILNFTSKKALEKQNENMQSKILSDSLKLKNYEQEKIKEIIVSVTKLMDIHDPYTNGHSENVAKLSQQLAIEMGLSNESIKDAYWSGMVHDLGKLLVPIEILNKQGPLTDDEFMIIKAHPVYGHEVLCHSASLSNIANYVLHHHERWDGNGYTDCLKGNEIPLISQILSVADSWDAMISERPYRKALTKEEAICDIQKNRGKQFSPLVVDAFMRLHNKKHQYINSAS